MRLFEVLQHLQQWDLVAAIGKFVAVVGTQQGF
jgi:hypothetical protein